ncbi:MAG: hypothetical protein MUE97_05295 [Phycisphaerales bacterium]|nr:hypothetical protein [Phycisphaerales bacterium]
MATHQSQSRTQPPSHVAPVAPILRWHDPALPRPLAQALAVACANPTTSLAEYQPLKFDSASGHAVHAALWHAPGASATPIIIKTEPLATATARLRAALGLTRTDRQLRGTRRLLAANIPAAPALALLDLPPSPTHPTARRLLILQRLPGETLLQHLADIHTGATPLSPPKQHDLARRVSTLFAALDAARLINRDPKPSNILIDPATLAPAFIDAVGVRRAWPPLRTSHAFLRSLCVLVIEPRGVHHPVRHTLIARFLHTLEPNPTARRWLWRVLTNHLRTRLQHDPTPRVNPLAR